MAELTPPSVDAAILLIDGTVFSWLSDAQSWAEGRLMAAVESLGSSVLSEPILPAWENATNSDRLIEPHRIEFHLSGASHASGYLFQRLGEASVDRWLDRPVAAVRQLRRGNTGFQTAGYVFRSNGSWTDPLGEDCPPLGLPMNDIELPPMTRPLVWMPMLPFACSAEMKLLFFPLLDLNEPVGPEQLCFTIDGDQFALADCSSSPPLIRLTYCDSLAAAAVHDYSNEEIDRLLAGAHDIEVTLRRPMWFVSTSGFSVFEAERGDDLSAIFTVKRAGVWRKRETSSRRATQEKVSRFRIRRRSLPANDKRDPECTASS